MLILIAAIIIVVLYFVLEILLFNSTTYHKTTGNSYFGTVLDKGKNGEYRIFKRLKYLEKQGVKFLFNVYFPKANGETTESDVIMITHRGVIVFESKNYSGWIFGDEKYRMWTQTLPQGQGRPARKERFFNPIMQNEIHIKYLKTVIGDNYSVRSIIAFSERCELKKVSVYSKDVQVVKRNRIEAAVKNAFKTMPENAISDEEIEKMYELLYPYSQVSDEVKEKHIESIKNNHAIK